MHPSVLFVNLPLIPYENLTEWVKGQRTESSSLAIPLGLLYVSAQAKARADAGTVELLDYALRLPELANYESAEDFIREEARRTVSSTPDIIAVSLLFSTSHRFFEVVVQTLRRLWPEATIVVGGIHATNCVGCLLGYEEVDYVFRGEGELAFSEFLRCHGQGRSIDIKGVYDKGHVGLQQFTDLCAWADDLDELPLPDWDLLDMERYVTVKGGRRNYGAATEQRICSILTTRGCPVRCTFCSAHTVHGRRVRYRSVESVVEEIRTLHERWGVTLFVPRDDLVTADKKRLVRLIDRAKSLGISGFEFQCTNGLHVNTVDEEIVDRLMELGTQTVNIAIESGSPYVQRHIIKKNCNLDKAHRLVRMCRSKGLLTRCYFIFGFPGETRELMEESARYIRALGADWCAVLTAAPLVGSEMYDQFVERGDIEESIELWSNAHFWRRGFDTEEISAAELNDFTYRLNLEVNFVNNINLQTGQFERAVALFSDIVLTYPFHVFAWHGLYRGYQGIGDVARAEEARKRLHHALANDERAREMYERHSDLLSNLPVEPRETVDC